MENNLKMQYSTLIVQQKIKKYRFKIIFFQKLYSIIIPIAIKSKHF